MRTQCGSRVPVYPVSSAHNKNMAENLSNPELTLDFLRRLVQRGGPETEEFGLLTNAFKALEYGQVSFESVRRALSPLLDTLDCLHGFGFQKPHGYAGDYEMIERIYTQWTSTDPNLRRWDEYFHRQAAPRAVRNRKQYFHCLLDRHLKGRIADASTRILNLGSGPMRDVFEHLNGHRNMGLVFECVEMDDNALRYGEGLCSEYSESVIFHKQNVLRFKSEQKFDLVWSAGLFDYFSDRVFRLVLRRLIPLVKPGGEIVIGNFSENNPSRWWMEAVGDWILRHRSPESLTNLALECGVSRSQIRVCFEQEGVNLFLHISL
jgi:extracellular factor (EF) 3-hydroxypalmitic acid methyl ester biosynthesis protein